jgi:hypothetical protein
MAIADSDLIQRHLEKVLVSGQLGKSETSRKLLTYLVQRSLQNDAPKETEIAIDVFGRNASFNGAEDSLVRVGVRTLRQKLAEYYAGPGSHDDVHFVIPKGGYRLSVEPRAEAPAPHFAPVLQTDLTPPATQAVAPAADLTSISRRRSRALTWTAAIGLVLLAVSVLANVYLWQRSTPDDGAEARVRQSPVWADIYASPRTLTVVLGDLFMYTQLDPRTGRTVTVRDTEINSSEELREFLASNPAFAAERGQRYTSMVPKSAAVGMAAILPIVVRPGRDVQVRILDELEAEDVRNNDIIFVGPFVRLGPLAGHYLLRSRYRYDREKRSLTDTVSAQAFLPEGALANRRMDYGLAAKFTGPTGNHIMILTSVGRNVGLLQIVRTLTSPEGLDAFEAKLRETSRGTPGSFEALLAVTGFKRTDLAADIVHVHTLPVAHPERRAASSALPVSQ